MSYLFLWSAYRLYFLYKCTLGPSNIYLVPGNRRRILIFLRKVNEWMISGRSWRPWAPRTTRGFGNSISSTQRFVFHLTSLSIMLKWDLSCPERRVWSTLSVLYILGGLNLWTLPCMRNCCCCSVAKLCLTLCDPMDCSMPGFLILCLNSCPLSCWCHPAISSSVALFLVCLWLHLGPIWIIQKGPTFSVFYLSTFFLAT